MSKKNIFLLKEASKQIVDKVLIFLEKEEKFSEEQIKDIKDKILDLWVNKQRYLGNRRKYNNIKKLIDNSTKEQEIKVIIQALITSARKNKVKHSEVYFAEAEEKIEKSVYSSQIISVIQFLQRKMIFYRLSHILLDNGLTLSSYKKKINEFEQKPKSVGAEEWEKLKVIKNDLELLQEEKSRPLSSFIELEGILQELEIDIPTYLMRVENLILQSLRNQARERIQNFCKENKISEGDIELRLATDDICQKIEEANYSNLMKKQTENVLLNDLKKILAEKKGNIDAFLHEVYPNNSKELLLKNEFLEYNLEEEVWLFDYYEFDYKDLDKRQIIVKTLNDCKVNFETLTGFLDSIKKISFRSSQWEEGIKETYDVYQNYKAEPFIQRLVNSNYEKIEPLERKLNNAYNFWVKKQNLAPFSEQEGELLNPDETFFTVEDWDDLEIQEKRLQKIANQRQQREVIEEIEKTWNQARFTPLFRQEKVFGNDWKNKLTNLVGEELVKEKQRLLRFLELAQNDHEIEKEFLALKALEDAHKASKKREQVETLAEIEKDLTEASSNINGWKEIQVKLLNWQAKRNEINNFAEIWEKRIEGRLQEVNDKIAEWERINREAESREETRTIIDNATGNVEHKWNNTVWLYDTKEANILGPNWRKEFIEEFIDNIVNNEVQEKINHWQNNLIERIENEEAQQKPQLKRLENDLAKKPTIETID